MTSVEPPAGNGTITSIGGAGRFGASAPMAPTATSIAAVQPLLELMASLRGLRQLSRSPRMMPAAAPFFVHLAAPPQRRRGISRGDARQLGRRPGVSGPL